MPKPTPALATETKALSEAYTAFNRNDVAAFGRIFDPRIEWIEFLELPGGGTYRGREAVLEHLAKGRERWAEGSCTPQRIIVAGERIVQIVHVRVRLKHETEWREGEVGEVYTFREGKVVEVRIFGESAEAMEWAGVDDLKKS